MSTKRKFKQLNGILYPEAKILMMEVETENRVEPISKIRKNLTFNYPEITSDDESDNLEYTPSLSQKETETYPTFLSVSPRRTKFAPTPNGPITPSPAKSNTPILYNDVTSRVTLPKDTQVVPVQPSRVTLSKDNQVVPTQSSRIVLPKDPQTAPVQSPSRVTLSKDNQVVPTQSSRFVLPKDPQVAPVQSSRFVLPKDPQVAPTQSSRFVLPKDNQVVPTQSSRFVLPKDPQVAPTQSSRFVLPKDPQVAPTQSSRFVLPKDPQVAPTQSSRFVLPKDPQVAPVQSSRFVLPKDPQVSSPRIVLQPAHPKQVSHSDIVETRPKLPVFRRHDATYINFDDHEINNLPDIIETAPILNLTIPQVDPIPEYNAESVEINSDIEQPFFEQRGGLDFSEPLPPLTETVVSPSIFHQTALIPNVSITYSPQRTPIANRTNGESIIPLVAPSLVPQPRLISTQEQNAINISMNQAIGTNEY